MEENIGETCACGGTCSCGGHQDQQEEEVVYLTREEYVARMEQYLAELKTEIQSVEAELAELREAA
jgi:hypothetical protein